MVVGEVWNSNTKKQLNVNLFIVAQIPPGKILENLIGK